MKVKPFNSASVAINPLIALITVKILKEADKTHTSIRNVFYNQINEYLLDVQQIKTLYHYVQEISKKRARLETYINYIIEKQNLTDWYARFPRTVHYILLFLVFLLKEETYAGGNPPSSSDWKHLFLYLLNRMNLPMKARNKKRFGTILQQIAELNFDELLLQIKEENPLSYYSFKFNYPMWLIKDLFSRYEEDFVLNFLHAENAPPNKYLRVRAPWEHLAEHIQSQLKKRFKSDVTLFTWSAAGRKTLPPLQLLVFQRFKSAENRYVQRYIPHQMIVQDKTSALIPTLLFPIQNEIVVDLTAGPGQKFTELLEYAENATIIGCEVDAERIQILMTWLSKLRDWIKKKKNKPLVFHTDALQFSLPPNSVDKILLDAPCTSTGIFAKYPDHRWHKIDLPAITTLQTRLLGKAIDLLRPGGIGVYSVCSLLQEEGENVVSKYLDVIEVLPFDEENQWTIPSSVGKRTFRHLHKTDNFFVALFKKK